MPHFPLRFNIMGFFNHIDSQTASVSAKGTSWSSSTQGEDQKHHLSCRILHRLSWWKTKQRSSKEIAAASFVFLLCSVTWCHFQRGQCNPKTQLGNQTWTPPGKLQINENDVTYTQEIINNCWLNLFLIKVTADWSNVMLAFPVPGCRSETTLPKSKYSFRQNSNIRSFVLL